MSYRLSSNENDSTECRNLIYIHNKQRQYRIICSFPIIFCWNTDVYMQECVVVSYDDIMQSYIDILCTCASTTCYIYKKNMCILKVIITSYTHTPAFFAYTVIKCEGLQLIFTYSYINYSNSDAKICLK